MNKKKAILSTLVVIVLAVVCTWYYVFVYSKHHHRDVTGEKAILISASDIAKQYQDNETNANTAYLDKAVAVSGEVVETGKNQDGKTTVSLKTDDPMTTVFCTLKDSMAIAEVGKNIKIKGVCIGFLSDVRLKDGIILK